MRENAHPSITSSAATETTVFVITKLRVSIKRKSGDPAANPYIIYRGVHYTIFDRLITVIAHSLASLLPSPHLSPFCGRSCDVYANGKTIYIFKVLWSISPRVVVGSTGTIWGRRKEGINESPRRRLISAINQQFSLTKRF